MTSTRVFSAASYDNPELNRIWLTDAYKEQYVKWKETTTKVVRPNIECTNGIIHLVDKVFIDNSPPWTVGSSAPSILSSLLIVMLSVIAALNQ